MARTITDDLLMLLATLADYHRRFSTFHGVFAVSDDPRFTKYRRLQQRYLDGGRPRRRLYQTWYKLLKSGYLEKRVFGNTEGYILTHKGRMKRFYLRIEDRHRPEQLPRGQWLMVFFDVPEAHRKIRDSLRRGLNDLGFQCIQKSVWVTRRRVGSQLRELIQLLSAQRYARPLLVRQLPK